MKLRVYGEDTIAFDVANYANDSRKMWEDIASVLKILTENNYEVLFNKDGEGIYAVNFNYHPRMNYESPRFMTVTDDEQEYLIAQRQEEDSEDF